ncbi:MAG: alpha-E domain-containing protein [Sphingomonadaceae bacterium]
MLGRTANGLFWMSRYLERAENTARLLEAAFRMALTRDLQTAEAEWRSLVETLGLRAIYEQHNDSYIGHEVWNFILRGRENPNSVVRMMNAVRSNARSTRTAITTELWTAINTSWMEISAQLKRPVSQGQVGEVVETIRRAGMLVHGAMEGTLLRFEGFHFARVGTFVERADNVARILDMKYYLLLPSLRYVGSTMDTGQWEQVLLSVSGDRAYHWLNAGRIEARGIVEFLVLDRRFPRSLAYCHGELDEELACLAAIHGAETGCHELMHEASKTFDCLTIDDIFEVGLHEFLTGFIDRNAGIAKAVADDYRFLA